MSARWMQSAGFALLAVTAIAGPCVNRSLAGPITPGSTLVPIPINDAPVQGQAVAKSALVIDQYRSMGISGAMFTSLSSATLINIGGVTAFAPVSASNSGYSLNFHSFIGMQIVDRVNGAPGIAHSVTVEFIGLRPGDGYLYAISPGGGVEGGTIADDGIGPHGGVLATLSFDQIGAFAVWSASPELLQGDHVVPWGIASITLDGDVVRTPEPATVSLACAGIVGAFGFARKRRRPAPA